MKNRISGITRVFGFVGAAILSAPAIAQSGDSAAVGFEQSATRVLGFEMDPCGFAGSSTLSTEATLSDGRVVEFTGLDFNLLAPDGSPLMTLGSLASAVFPSFVVISPDETYAVAGESCTGNIYRIELTGGLTLLTTLNFNFDAAFLGSSDLLFVSAAATTAFGRNQLYRVNGVTGATVLRGRLAGFSGPVTTDGDGRLYYATQVSGAPVEIISWSASQLSGGPLLSEANASPFVAGLTSGSGLTFDPLGNNLVLTQFDAIRLFATDGTDRGQIVTAIGSTFLANTEVMNASGTGSLQPFQPENSVIRYTATDFFSFADRRTVVTARPVATLTGPTSGAVTRTLTITGAHPNALVQVFFNNIAFLNPSEFVLGGDFPFHTALLPNRARRINPPLMTDANGTASFSYQDPGTLHGTLVFQAAIFDDAGDFVGTSTFELN